MKRTELVSVLAGIFAVSLALGCGDETTKPSDDADTRNDELEGDADASTKPDRESDAAMPTTIVGKDDPSTVGNDAAGDVSCSADVDGCGEAKTCCGSGFGESACQAKCGADEVETVCDGPEDCKQGELCCSGIGTNACIAEHDVCEGSVNCHTDDDCPVGTVCTPGNSFTWWGFCK